MVIYLNDDSIYRKGRKFYTQALDSIAESLSNDGFGRFVTWFILWITWQNVPMDRGELVASVSGDTTWIESLCVKSFFHSCELNRRLFFFLNSIVLLFWARGSLDSLFVCLFFFLKKGEGGVLVQRCRFNWWNTILLYSKFQESSKKRPIAIFSKAHTCLRGSGE